MQIVRYLIGISANSIINWFNLILGKDYAPYFLNMAIPVMKFSREGYKIRKVFG